MSVNQFTYDVAGLRLTESSEGLRLSAYQDQVGRWTIGYGHTGPDVHEGLTITQQEAEQLLEADIHSACECVSNCVTVQLTQNEFDALVDFVFNLGAGSFKSSTLLTDLNAGNFPAAAGQFQRWDHAGGAVVAGLLNRRQQEATLFQANGTTIADA